MKILPDLLINLQKIDEINVLGKGGKESQIIHCLFPKAERPSNSSMWDCEINYDNITYKIEIKKQFNDQWFDIGKYYKLTEENRKIILLFLLHDNHYVVKIIAIRLGTLIEILLSDKRFKKYGWENYILKFAFECKQPENSPELQFKAKLKVRDFALNPLYQDQFQVIYERGAK